MKLLFFTLSAIFINLEKNYAYSFINIEAMNFNCHKIDITEKISESFLPNSQDLKIKCLISLKHSNCNFEGLPDIDKEISFSVFDEYTSLKTTHHFNHMLQAHLLIDTKKMRFEIIVPSKDFLSNKEPSFIFCKSRKIKEELK